MAIPRREVGGEVSVRPTLGKRILLSVALGKELRAHNHCVEWEESHSALLLFKRCVEFSYMLVCMVVRVASGKLGRLSF